MKKMFYNLYWATVFVIDVILFVVIKNEIINNFPVK